MKGAIALSASILASVACAQQSGPACNAISYDMSSHPGSVTYSSVLKYSFAVGGGCQMQSQTFTSPISPLDQGLTAVFRGPIHLKQFAVYNEAASSKKRSPKASPRERRHHNHERFHKKHPEADAGPELNKRSCGDPVTATIDSAVVTFTDKWDCSGGPASQAPATQAPAASTSTPAAAVSAKTLVVANSASAASPSAPPQPAASSAPASSNSGGSSNNGSSGSDFSCAWDQVAYYSASSPSGMKNVTFLYPVPYSNTDFLPSSGDMKNGPASNAQALEDVLIQDDDRFYVASGMKMSSSADPSNKAYHGFAGNKVILVEIGMPLSNLRGQGSYPDSPAFWFLNEQLPATSDSSACNCWATGCGEFDVHEILTPGAMIGYSTMHMGQNYCGGASNGFNRATTGTQKLAVIMRAGSDASDSVVRIVQLEDSYSFDNSISESDYQNWLDLPVAGGQKGSLHTSGCPT